MLRRVYERHPTFRDVLFGSKIAAVARNLMQSSKVILFADSLFSKEPGTDIETPWHHDLPFWPVRGEQVCTTWLALDPVSKANGRLEYVSGSHRWGRMFRPKAPRGVRHELKGHEDFEEIPDIEAERTKHDILSWDMEPGDMLIHQACTVHGAGENTMPNFGRRAYAPRFVGEKAWWEPTFHTDTTKPEADRLAKGNPVDRFGIFPIVLDVNAPTT